MRITARLGPLVAVARTNHDLLTTAQLREHGLGSREVQWLVRDGVLERILRGLYRLSGTRTCHQDIAATLSRHDGAVASHRTALFLHGLRNVTPVRPDFTVARSATGATTLGTLHRSPLPSQDVTSVDEMATTTMARSIVDAGRYLSVDQLSELLDVAVSSRRVSVDQIADVIARVEREPGRGGCGRVRAALRPWSDGIRPDSPAEAVVLRRIRDAGLPAPVAQHEVIDEDGVFVARVDFAWPEPRVVREYDSDRWHGPDRIEVDELRRQRLEALGYRVGVVTRLDLRPSATRWLRTLEADLGAGRRAAS